MMATAASAMAITRPPRPPRPPGEPRRSEHRGGDRKGIGETAPQKAMYQVRRAHGKDGRRRKAGQTDPRPAGSDGARDWRGGTGGGGAPPGCLAREGGLDG